MVGMETEESAKEYIYRSRLHDIDIPDHLPLHTFCFQNIDDYRDKPCIINGGTDEVYTYGEVELTARRVAAGLHRLGVKQGEVIMILLPNSPEFVFSFLGASFRGAVSTTANPLSTPQEIAKQANASGAKVIITQACSLDKVRDMADERGLKVVCIDAPLPGCSHFSELTGTDEAELPEMEILPDDVVALPYSSGTTGLPKGVMLTHKGQVTNVSQLIGGDNPNLYLGRDDVVLCVLPLFHIYSLSALFWGLRTGAAVVMMQRFEIGAFMEVIQKYKVTMAPIVPSIVLAIVKSPVVDEYDLSSIRRVMSGAAPMGKELEDAVRAKLPNAKLGQGYGMTEAGPVLSVCLALAKEPSEIKSGSCGTVVRNAELKIIDPDTGASLPRNESGEICIRGAQIMKGYLNDPEATQKTIDKEGWLHTGDVGYIDDDDELFIVDRLKEIMKCKGYQVAPAELEAVLISHPKLADAAVVPMKDELAGEVPVAFVVKSNESLVSEDEIKQFIREQVVFYKRLNRVFFVDSIPKAPSGKILKKDLRARLANGFPN